MRIVLTRLRECLTEANAEFYVLAVAWARLYLYQRKTTLEPAMTSDFVPAVDLDGKE